MKLSVVNWLRAAILVLLIGVLALGAYLKNVSDYKKKVEMTTIREINLSDIPDGTYEGEYDVDFVYAKVSVTVQNGEIKNIAILEHKNGHGQPAEVVTDRIVEEQRIDVDTVSGATNSSIVLKKAVENALDQA